VKLALSFFNDFEEIFWLRQKRVTNFDDDF
jgi:hypothetical protein